MDRNRLGLSAYLQIKKPLLRSGFLVSESEP